jgi:histidyl-tRNA synthetase
MSECAICKKMKTIIVKNYVILIYTHNIFIYHYMKNPRGSVDLYGNDLFKMITLYNIAKTVFDQVNGKRLKTPVFELEKTLASKYGNDEKLIFKCSEDTALRFDQTVPLCRYVCEHKVEKCYKWKIL